MGCDPPRNRVVGDFSWWQEPQRVARRARGVGNSSLNGAGNILREHGEGQAEECDKHPADGKTCFPSLF